MNRTDVLVIGGGISGLSIARMLADAGVAVELWESSKQTGGKIQTQHHQGYRLEQSASIVMNFRDDVERFLAACGLNEHKKPLPASTNRYLVAGNKLCPVPFKVASVMTSPLWTWQGKLRMALEPFVRKGHDEEESAANFIRRRLGNEFLDKAMEPFIAGTLASNAEQANAASVLPRMTALEKRYGNLLLGMIVHKITRRRTAVPAESFSFRHGMSTLTDMLASNDGINIHTQCRATNLVRDKLGWQIYGHNDEVEQVLRAKHVIVCTPADSAAALIKDLDAELGRLLNAIEYAPVAVVHTGFKRNAITHSLQGNGFLTTAGDKPLVNGCLWMSSLFSDRTPTDRVLMSNYLGGARRPEAAYWGKDRCVDNTLQYLKPLLGIRQEPEMVYIHRHKQGLPQYNGAYRSHTAAIAGRLKHLPGLHLLANYAGGVSIRDRISCSFQLAQQLIPEFILAEQKDRTYCFNIDRIPLPEADTGSG